MIVNHTNEGWEIIYQKAHGLLAASIAQFWKKSERPQSWLETLVAICEHDDNQQNWHDKHHLTSSGTPQDFSLQAPDLEQASRILQAAKVKSRWIALLISSHINYLYHDKTDNNKPLEDLLKEQELFRHQTLKSLKIRKHALDQAYRLMNWCDTTSLILCKNLLPPDERELEVAPGPKVSQYYMFQRKGTGSIAVNPWPFEVKEFTVQVESRLINQIAFKDDGALHRSLQETPVSVKSWRFVK